MTRDNMQQEQEEWSAPLVRIVCGRCAGSTIIGTVHRYRAESMGSLQGVKDTLWVRRAWQRGDIREGAPADRPWFASGSKALTGPSAGARDIDLWCQKAHGEVTVERRSLLAAAEGASLRQPARLAAQ